MVSREELFITSKLFIQDADELSARKAIENSLEVMGLDYLDLYLIHQPYGDIYGAYRTMVDMQKEGKIKAIGVSNFSSGKIIEFCSLNDIKPQINQIEVNPWNQRINDQKWNEKYTVQVEACAPFAEGRLDLFNNPILQSIGSKYNKSIAQIVLRWLIQRNIVVLAKTVQPKRMKENIEIFDFNLTTEDIKMIESLNKNESAFFSHEDPQQVEWFMRRK